MKRRQNLGGLAIGRSSVRVFRIRPDHDMPHVVEVRIARTRKHMHAEMLRLDGSGATVERECMGQVRHWYSKVNARPIVRPGMMIARMYLNADDLRSKPGEIISHECTHAGMAWARLRKANLKRMPGEEVLCYAVGKMVAQVNSIGYAMGVWR